MAMAILLPPASNQMPKAMPVEFPGLLDCNIDVVTNLEVNQKDPCAEPIEVAEKGIS